MKNLSSSHELEQLKEAYKSAKEARKLAKEAYKAQIRAQKAQLKSFKQALKQAEKLEKQTKSAYKAFAKDADITNVKKEVEEEALSTIQQPVMEPEMPASKPEPATAAKAKKGPKPKAEKTEPAPAKVSATRGRKKSTPTGGDDLTQIKGVGDKVAAMLKANGINTFAEMASTSFERFKELLKANGMSKYRNPSTWAAAAADLAGMSAPEASPALPAKERKPKTEPAVKAKRGPKPKVEKIENETPKVEPEAKAPASKGGRRKKTVKVYDDLTKIPGIGAKVAEALNQSGITSYKDMAETSIERFREILIANNMSKYRSPANWASQAEELLKSE